jgi:hypothetical protein
MGLSTTENDFYNSRIELEMISNKILFGFLNFNKIDLTKFREKVDLKVNDYGYLSIFQENNFLKIGDIVINFEDPI